MLIERWKASHWAHRGVSRRARLLLRVALILLGLGLVGGARAQGYSASLDTTSLDFGTVTIGSTSAPLGVTLTNTGTTAASLDHIDIAGPDAVSFSIWAAPAPPLSSEVEVKLSV